MSSLPGLDRVKALFFDVDGVLTDNGLYLGEGDVSFKRFDIRDGAGLKLAQAAGLLTGLISGHASEATRRRAKELGIPICHTGVRDKVAVLRREMAERDLSPDDVLYMGDDVLDLPALRVAGFGVTVPEAADEVKAVCDLVTERPGGRGAVRELVEHLLRETGRYEAALASILGESDGSRASGP